MNYFPRLDEGINYFKPFAGLNKLGFSAQFSTGDSGLPRLADHTQNLEPHGIVLAFADPIV
jgi:hypothetical protein